MLQVEHIRKEYKTGGLVQKALDDVSLGFRDHEFVAILGPSGSGKTTLLNIIGGLDRYDSGDLIINGRSTKKYKDRDWDRYRNHSIGFVFQSYNLIPHQSVLANVELALTISGISRSERRMRAISVLNDVGLKDHVHKRPNQLSGGQMQRVAIARALVNNPEILLADEPTGALDSETSVQVMDLLRKVADDRLVIMVTHNPELAAQYATRIVNLKDGVIRSDSDPYTPSEMDVDETKVGKASMSWLTALSLSFNNLNTKKGRTLLTSFAGSIGIIGIALILALSTGVNTYITNVQRSTMSAYPITIDAQSVDLSATLAKRREEASNTAQQETPSQLSASLDGFGTDTPQGIRVAENDMKAFKAYLDDPNSEIHQYIGGNGLAYSYDVAFDVYAHDAQDTLVNTDGSTFDVTSTSVNSFTSLTQNQSATAPLTQMLAGADGQLVSSVITDAYQLLSGSWPTSYDEVVLVVDADGSLPLQTLFNLGFIVADQYDTIKQEIEDGQTPEGLTWNTQDVLGKRFSLVLASDYYVQQSSGNYVRQTDQDAVVQLAADGVQLKVSGVVRATDDNENIALEQPLAYTQALTDYLLTKVSEAPVIQAQEASPTINVLNGLAFDPADDAQKVADAKTYLNDLGISVKAALWRNMANSVYAGNATILNQISQASETQLAQQADNYFAQADDAVLLNIYKNYVQSGSYEDNMTSFGYVDVDDPASVSIYADSFVDKQGIADSITHYNEQAKDGEQITYVDYVALMMSSVTNIVNIISYVLIAFVSVSLIVSSIMIGIITYISVLERTKEIGILRSIGASKRNISQVFNAETFIIGLLSGLIGIGVTYLIMLPGNAVLHRLLGNEVSAHLKWMHAVVLILISIFLTLLGGWIPAKKAAKQDPVKALRSE